MSHGRTRRQNSFHSAGEVLDYLVSYRLLGSRQEHARHQLLD